MKRALLLGLLLLATDAAHADVLVLTNGRKLRGGVHREEAEGIAWNPYFSRNPGMVFDVESFPRTQVKEIVREEPLFCEYLRKSTALAAEDLAGRLDLAAWCEERKLEDEAELELLAALRIDPENEEALKRFGRSKFPKMARGNPDFDPAARAAIDEYLAIGDPAERKKAHGRLKRESSVDLPREYLDRVLRSRSQPTGLQKDRALTFQASESPGVYTIFVPKEYDPRRAWPLVIGLHGGGAGGKDRDAVVGSGDSAMNFYVRQAAARGYIVVCPNALAAPWAAPKNEPLVRAIIDEVELLYHVDLNRVYLTGHSMGGFGTWHFGPKWAEEFAAISPMAGGGGGGGVPKLVDTNTPVFVFHGADDGVVGPSSDRAAARQLAKTDLDFIYTELTGIGHGFPDSIQKDLFDFFDVRRLASSRGRRAGPPSAQVRSSFLGKVSREEIRYLGDPLLFATGDAVGAVDTGDLLKDLRLGGGKAEAAADALGQAKDENAVKPLSDLLRHPATADDVKIQAARALGMIGHEDGHPGLAVGLRSETPEVVAASARAMAATPGEKPAEALLGALGHAVKMIESKVMANDQVHITDWERWLEAFGAVVTGVGERGIPGGISAIRRTAVDRFLAREFDVLYSRRVGQDPARARRAFALVVVAAVAALDEPDREETLAAIEAAADGDGEIVRASRAALE